MNDGTLRCPHGNPAKEVVDGGWAHLEALRCENCDREVWKSISYRKEPKPMSEIELTETNPVAELLEAEDEQMEDAAEPDTEQLVTELTETILAHKGARSKATTINPKDLVGDLKVSITKLPAVAVAHAARAMMDGAKKYGPYNWRQKDVVAHIYVDAALRHLYSWLEGEEFAADSGVHHLGHAIACCAILLDAQENGNLIDDRPSTERTQGVMTRVLDRLKLVPK